MSLIIDSSALVSLALDGEDVALARAAVEATVSEGAYVPALFWYEIRNVLALSQRRGRTTLERTQEFLDDVEALSLTVDYPPNSDAVLEYARLYGLTVYDAAYLELTLRTNSRLASHDEALRKAVLAAGGALFTA